MQALVLAAGYGTRMGSIANDTPKHLLEIKPGTPVINLVIKEIANAKNIEKIYLVVNNKFYSHFESWLEIERINIKKPVYLINNKTNTNEERLGSVGDIIYGLEKIKDTELARGLLIAQGDDLIYDLSVNKLLEEYRIKGSTIIIVHRIPVHDLTERFGVVEVYGNNKIKRIKEKPKLEEITTKDGTALANGGFYVIARSDLQTIKKYGKENKKPLDNTGKLFSWMVDYGIPIFVYEHPKEMWWDIGNTEDLKAARKFYQEV